jgi:hypothetical protein
MAISPEYQQLAKQLGVVQSPEQSDLQFMQWLDNLRNHIALIREARDLGVTIQPGVKSAELRQAICSRQQELLQERGFVPEAVVKLGDRTVKIQKIVVQKGRHPKVTVHYWILSPWTNDNDRGRANHRPAKEILQRGELVR